MIDARGAKSLSGVTRATHRVGNWAKLWECILRASLRLTEASEPVEA